MVRHISTPLLATPPTRMMISFGLLLLQLYPSFVFGLNKADITDTVGFVREDNQRDTLSLLLSCFATLGLCIYSAVHLNIPRKGESNYRILCREFKWCVIGLFAPELILYTAWRQLASARELCCNINQVLSGGSSDHTSSDKVCHMRTALTFAKTSNYCLDKWSRQTSICNKPLDACAWLLWLYGRVRNRYRCNT